MAQALINPNLKHLRIFVEIARRGSFRSAARTLHLSEPAVSQAMTQLESLLTIKLLDRTTRSVRVTEVGSAFLVDAERILDGLDRSVKSAREYAKTGRASVTLACLSSTVYRILPPALTEMRRAHPGINVVFKDDNMRGILNSIENDECDLAIVSDDDMNKRTLSIPLIKDTFQVVCPANHPLAKQQRITGADLSAYDLVMLRRGSGIRDSFDRAIEKRALKMSVIHETTQIHTLLGLVESGLGATVLPSMLCPPESHPTTVVRPLITPSIVRSLGLLYPPGKDPSMGARILAEVIYRSTMNNNLQLPKGVKKFANSGISIPYFK